MSRKLGQTRDGIYQRNDPAGFGLAGPTHRAAGVFEKRTLKTSLKPVRSGQQNYYVLSRPKFWVSVLQAKTTLKLSLRYLVHQKVRLSKASYVREKLSIDKHLSPFFPGKLSAIRRQDVQRYITKRSSQVPLTRFKKN